MPIYSHLPAPPLVNRNVNASPGKAGLRTGREHRQMNERQPCETNQNRTLLPCCHTYNSNKIIFIYLRNTTVMFESLIRNYIKFYIFSGSPHFKSIKQTQSKSHLKVCLRVYRNPYWMVWEREINFAMRFKKLYY